MKVEDLQLGMEYLTSDRERLHVRVVRLPHDGGVVVCKLGDMSGKVMEPPEEIDPEEIVAPWDGRAERVAYQRVTAEEEMGRALSRLASDFANHRERADAVEAMAKAERQLQKAEEELNKVLQG